MNAFRPAEETMTPEEAQAVVRRHLERLPAGEAGPSVVDVAEALGVPPERVAALLNEVRTVPVAPTRRRSLVLPTLAALILSLFLFVLFVRASVSPAVPIAATPAMNYQAVSSLGGTTSFNASNLDATFLRERLDSLLDAALSPLPSTDEENRAGLAAIQAGKWDAAPNVFLVAFDVRRPGRSGAWVRMLRLSLPYYSGDDAKIDALVFEERVRRISEALKDAPPR